mmetsp:Transcript_20794/g.70800  ORF Transcript_20794/g.70800 Transcript_20794/m.70800 type:complete len:576 (-) Transcript_20794:120-1847(-)
MEHAAHNERAAAGASDNLARPHRHVRAHHLEVAHGCYWQRVTGGCCAERQHGARLLPRGHPFPVHGEQRHRAWGGCGLQRRRAGGADRAQGDPSPRAAERRAGGAAHQGGPQLRGRQGAVRRGAGLAPRGPHHGPDHRLPAQGGHGDHHNERLPDREVRAHRRAGAPGRDEQGVSERRSRAPPRLTPGRPPTQLAGQPAQPLVALLLVVRSPNPLRGVRGRHAVRDAVLHLRHALGLPPPLPRHQVDVLAREHRPDLHGRRGEQAPERDPQEEVRHGRGGHDRGRQRRVLLHRRHARLLLRHRLRDRHGRRHHGLRRGGLRLGPGLPLRLRHRLRLPHRRGHLRLLRDEGLQLQRRQALAVAARRVGEVQQLLQRAVLCTLAAVHVQAAVARQGDDGRVAVHAQGEERRAPVYGSVEPGHPHVLVVRQALRQLLPHRLQLLAELAVRRAHHQEDVLLAGRRASGEVHAGAVQLDHAAAGRVRPQGGALGEGDRVTNHDVIPRRDGATPLLALLARHGRSRGTHVLWVGSLQVVEQYTMPGSDAEQGVARLHLVRAGLGRRSLYKRRPGCACCRHC